eukprot:PhF_6_TR34186/c0_g1_i2/m.50053
MLSKPAVLITVVGGCAAGCLMYWIYISRHKNNNAVQHSPHHKPHHSSSQSRCLPTTREEAATSSVGSGEDTKEALQVISEPKQEEIEEQNTTTTIDKETTTTTTATTHPALRPSRRISSSELGLLPRILERASDGASFFQHLTSFDNDMLVCFLSYLTKEIKMLEIDATVDLTVVDGLLQRLEKEQKKIHTADQEEEDLPLRLTYLVSETHDGRMIFSSTIFSAEEEEYSEDSIISEKIATPEADFTDDDEEDKVTDDAAVGDVVLLIGYGSYIHYPIDPRTIETETRLLSDTLRRSGNGVEVVELLGPDATGGNIRDVIKAIHPSLIYAVTPLHNDHVVAPPQHCIVTADNTALTFEDIHKLYDGQKHKNVTICVDTQSAFEVFVSHNHRGGGGGDDNSVAIAKVSLTSGAYLVAGSVLWLFDGHFTPRVIQYLLNNSKGGTTPTPCVANIIAHVLHALVPHSTPSIKKKGQKPEKTFEPWPHDPFVNAPFPCSNLRRQQQ